MTRHKNRTYQVRFDLNKEDETIDIGGTEYMCNVVADVVALYDSGCRGTWDDPPEDDSFTLRSVELEITLIDDECNGTLKMNTMQAFKQFFSDSDEEIYEACREYDE